MKSPSAPGGLWWKVIAKRDSFLDAPGHQQLQWDRPEGAECTITTDSVHENEYEKIKEAQDLSIEVGE